MNCENIRLRIQASTAVKFYVKINKSADLKSLKKLIIKILDFNYKISLTNFSLKCADGFDILDHFAVGEILEDNQIVFVDTLSMHSRVSGEAFRKSRSPVLDTNDMKSDIKSSIRSDMKSDMKSSIKSDMKSSIKSDMKSSIRSDMKSDMKSSIGSDSILTPSNNSKENSVFTDKNERIESFYKNNKEYLKEKEEKYKKNEQILKSQNIKLEESKSEQIEISNENKFVSRSDSSHAEPIFEGGFKGFAVHKKDLERNRNSSILSQNTFKPLKKRRVEEAIDLI